MVGLGPEEGGKKRQSLDKCKNSLNHLKKRRGRGLNPLDRNLTFLKHGSKQNKCIILKHRAVKVAVRVSSVRRADDVKDAGVTWYNSAKETAQWNEITERRPTHVRSERVKEMTWKGEKRGIWICTRRSSENTKVHSSLEFSAQTMEWRTRPASSAGSAATRTSGMDFTFSKSRHREGRNVLLYNNEMFALI